MLYTACILKETPTGVLRISTMSRHTFADGKRPDLRLAGRYDQHWLELAPSAKLVGAWYHREISWDEYVARYLAEIRQPSKTEQVSRLISLALSIDVAVLCIEDDPSQCHRRLLAAECQLRCPGLMVHIA